MRFLECQICGRRGTRGFTSAKTHLHLGFTRDQVICAAYKACERRATAQQASFEAELSAIQYGETT